jgi:CHAT domain-containing protein
MSYLWAISGAQSKAAPLSDQQQISQDVASYRALIEQEKRDPLASASQAGARLYQELIAPVSALLPHGSRVVVVPDSVLHNLNFETLLAPSPRPHFWIEDVTISIVPSLGIVQAGRTRLSARRSLLLMGDPVTQGTGYPPLPQAALEIAKVQRQFPANQSTVLTGPQAVVDAYSAAQPGRFSTIHFATHVDANAQSPLDSSIILSPQPNGFRLYARDVAQMPLHADLVTISACRGAGARTLSGEGLVGFAWAFFQARAQNVVTSLWDVYDNSTAQLMDDFYSGVAAGHSYADSLRLAKLKMLHSNYQRPYYWAPFQLYSRSIF